MGTFISRGLLGYDMEFTSTSVEKNAKYTILEYCAQHWKKKIKIDYKGDRIMKNTVIGKNCKLSKNTLCLSKAQIYCLAQLESSVTA